MAEVMYLRKLVQKLGWSYAALWSAQDSTTDQLVFGGGTFEANPLGKYETIYYDVEALFKDAYKTCRFPRGSGYVGKALAGNQPIWLNGTDNLSINWSNHCGQSKFFKVTGIQTLLCIPWCNSVVELGSSLLEHRNPSFVAQIRTFLSKVLSPRVAEQQQVMTHSHPFSQALSNGSDDASFNGGAHHDQQVDSGPPFALSQQALRPGGQNIFAAAAVSPEVIHERHMSGSGESNWASNFTSARTLQQQQRDLESPQSATSPLQMQQQMQLQQQGWMEGGAAFDESTFLVSPRTQQPLLSQLNYNQSISSSLSSSKSDNEDHNTDSNGNQHSSLEHLYLGNSNASPSSVMNSTKPGFTPWTSISQRNFAGSQKKKSRTNQAMLQRAISMTQRIPHRNGALSNHRQSSMGAQRQASSGLQSGDLTASFGARPNDVMSVHDEAALHHMMAERRRRQKQKENFTALRALIPFVSKMDRASILEDAIRYVKELSSRVEELETCNRELEAQIPLSQRRRNKSSTSL